MSNVVAAQEQFQQQADANLIKACQAGDKQAYQQLYQRYCGQVYALCVRLMVDQGLAEDATQEVFIQLWRKLDNYRGDSKFSTWLHSVTSNVAISYLRKQKSWFQRMFSLEDNDHPLPSQVQEGHDLDLDDYVKRLPERARVVFVLHAIEGRRHEDIARMLGIAEGSSKSQYHRAKQLLKGWMNDE